MKCVSMGQFNPITGAVNKNTFPCGKCSACKINHRRKWTARILLESFAWRDASWITLTYDEKNLPENGELNPEHLTNFLKSLRKKLKQKIRYFAVGEYGDKFGRPHYHAIIWNYHPHIIVDRKDPRRWYDPIIESAWGKGGTLNEDLMASNNLPLRCAYIAAYVLKKYKNKGSLKDQQEFARMSRMPAVGSSAVPELAKTLTTKLGAILLGEIGTIPDQFRHKNKLWPIPKIIREKVGQEIGVPVFPISININSKDVLTLDQTKVKQWTYGPPPEIEEDTPAKAFARGEQARKRIARENLNRENAVSYAQRIQETFGKKNK